MQRNVLSQTAFPFPRRLAALLCGIVVITGGFRGQGARAVTAAEPDALPQEQDYYQITRFETPPGKVIEVGGFQLMSDGRLAVSSRRGEIWMVADPLAEQVTADQFHRFAHGLHEPLSLAEKEGWLYVTQRPEVTRIRDADGDGRADAFVTVADGWGISGDYHEYAFSSKFDQEDNLWVTLCLTGSFSSQVPFRGWCVRVTPDGETIPTTSGIRSPGGVGMNAAGDIFYTDNQGPWNGTCGLKQLLPGKFVGHPGGFSWYELAESFIGPQPAKPTSDSRIMTEADKIPQLEPPAVLFPYQKMGQSASGIACDTTGGKFGPFAGQLFVADQTHSTIMRVDLEKVQGHYQGACFPFRAGFGSGNVGVEMAPSGALFVGGTNRGWGSRGNQPFAIERLDWTGKVPFEIRTMRVVPEGFELTFTQPLDAATARDPASYELSTYTYIYREQYGSPEVDHTEPTIEAIEVDQAGQRVTLTIDGLQRGHVHELHAEGVRDHHGHPLLHAEAYYTLNYLP
jgi:glucose/arabinose dehydrogenase